jgi:hypothetical protein
LRFDTQGLGLEGLTEAAVELFEPELWFGVKLERQDQAADDTYLGLCHEAGTERPEPVGINDRIIISKGNELATRRRDAAISCRRDSSHRLREQLHSLVIGELGEGRPWPSGAIVHDEDLKVGVVQLQKRVDGSKQLVT